MTWIERLNGRAAPKRPAPAQMTSFRPPCDARPRRPWFRPARLDGRSVVKWYAESRPDLLARLRDRAELARHARPRDALAHAACAAALIAAVRGGLTDDIDEDEDAARSAAEIALSLAPRDPFVMALTAPAFVQDDPYRARDLLAAALRKLGARVPEALIRAAHEGARRPASR